MPKEKVLRSISTEYPELTEPILQAVVSSRYMHSNVPSFHALRAKLELIALELTERRYSLLFPPPSEEFDLTRLHTVFTVKDIRLVHLEFVESLQSRVGTNDKQEVFFPVVCLTSFFRTEYLFYRDSFITFDVGTASAAGISKAVVYELEKVDDPLLMKFIAEDF